ncbi:forkhead box protein P3 [Pimephales promelas]|nr:forkhead box protein P3 [Pimephales promelas]
MALPDKKENRPEDIHSPERKEKQHRKTTADYKGARELVMRNGWIFFSWCFRILELARSGRLYSALRLSCFRYSQVCTILPHSLANDSHPAAMNRRKETAQISIHAVSDRKQSSSLHHHSPVQTEIQRSSSLYINGQCRWPGCDKVFEGYTHFLRHLNRDHSTDEKTIAQWRVQQDLVRHMENQLIQEKQKLHAMQIHLQLFDCISACTGVATGRWRPLALKLPPLGEPDGRTERAREAPVQQDPWHIPPTHMLPDFVSSVEYYKYANIRPPYTYAFLIRWSIVEAPEKQRTLNEIYNWFTRMFYYFRHSSPTWKNAVRHNLSLHKCFVRVDGRMGAVWTVDEEEFQKRKGQKINSIPVAQQNFLRRICNLSHLDVVRRVTFERMKGRLSAGEDERALASILTARRDNLTAGHHSSLMPPDSSGLSTTFKS